MSIKNLQHLLAAFVLGVVLAPVALADPPEHKGKGNDSAQGKHDKDSNDWDDDKGKHANDNHGQQVSECNHRANERNLKGQDRKNFVEWCTDHGSHYNYDDGKYRDASACYRLADTKGLTGDFRRVFVQDCLRKRNK